MKTYKNILLSILFIGVIGLTINLYRNSEKIKIRATDVSFELLNSFYSKDNQHAYWERNIIEGADIGSFEVLTDYYSKDKNNIYAGNKIIGVADRETFSVINDAYSRDKNHIYWLWLTIHSADLDSFEPLSNTSAKDKNKTYDRNIMYREEIYTKNFQGENYDLSNNFEIQNILDLELYDQQSLRILNEFIKDDNGVYFWRNEKTTRKSPISRIKKIGDAQTEDFKFLIQFDGFSFGRDNKNLFQTYKGIQKINLKNTKLDITTLEFLTPEYLTDKSMVYINKKISPDKTNNFSLIKDADPETFVLLDAENRVGKDKNFVFKKDKKYTINDINSFEILNTWYSKDKTSVYYGLKEITEGDLTTFEIVSDVIAKDKNYVYYQGEKKTEIDSKTFVNVEETINSRTDYYKDRNNVYYYTLKKIDGVDPNTVKVVNTLEYEQLSNTIKDKNNWYQDGIRKKESELITFWAGG